MVYPSTYLTQYLLLTPTKKYNIHIIHSEEKYMRVVMFDCTRQKCICTDKTIYTEYVESEYHLCISMFLKKILAHIYMSVRRILAHTYVDNSGGS